MGIIENNSPILNLYNFGDNDNQFMQIDNSK